MSTSATDLLAAGRQPSAPEKIRIAVLGLEPFGRVRAADLALRVPHAEVCAIASRSWREARECARTCGIDRSHRDAGALIEDPDIDALVIDGPVESRAEWVVRAAQAGKPALVAPPIDLDPAAVDRAIRAGFEHGTRLQIGFHRRFDSRALELRQILREGGLGMLARIRVHRRLPVVGMPASGQRARLVREALVHALDLLRFISGEEIVELMTSRSAVEESWVLPHALVPARDRGPRSGIATSIVTASLSGGGLATVEITEVRGPGQAERIEIEGSRGSIGRGGPMLIDAAAQASIGAVPPQARFANREARALLAESRSFVEAVRWGRPVAVGPHEAREAAILLEAARRAQILGRSIRPDDVASELLRSVQRPRAPERTR